VDAIDEQSAVVTLECLGELVEEVDELLGRVAGELQRQAHDRQIIGFHGYRLAVRDFFAAERAAARFAARSFASLRR
jgi:hypothetical protein